MLLAVHAMKVVIIRCMATSQQFEVLCRLRYAITELYVACNFIALFFLLFNNQISYYIFLKYMTVKHRVTDVVLTLILRF